MIRYHAPVDFSKDCVPFEMIRECDGCGDMRYSMALVTMYGRHLCAQCSEKEPPRRVLLEGEDFPRRKRSKSSKEKA